MRFVVSASARSLHSMASSRVRAVLGIPASLDELTPSTLRASARSLHSMTSSRARAVLDIPASLDELTPSTLRDAYFAASLRVHPDVNPGNTNTSFVRVTEAFEHLAESLVVGEADIIGRGVELTVDEESAYREACLAVLGLSAEQVEQSKADEQFRLWLGGDTYSTTTWNTFLSLNGGLVPRNLRQSIGVNDGAR